MGRVLDRRGDGLIQLESTLLPKELQHENVEPDGQLYDCWAAVPSRKLRLPSRAVVYSMMVCMTRAWRMSEEKTEG